ncbi:MAG: UbiH/UbiF/VisC/COQ6 family ubiquinone biosynthesis hydroxylase [Thalassobaculum sp.]|uniref:UbiH/UbiF/VisC/COQ6 family ubiquinone biosynthesis hydroxylase n=1 Tax=Thalassobaculum sp. TaxID=2022740 RepID=UPI0032ED8FFD
MERADAVIAGAGLSGLSVALALAEAGLRVAVVDRSDPRATHPRSPGGDIRTTAISLSSRRLLTALGAWDAVAGDAEPILDIRVSDADSPLHMHYDHKAVGDEPMGHIVVNQALKESLLDRLAARPEVVIADPGTVAELSVTPAAATLTLTDGRRLTGALVVGADGRDSAVRSLARLRVTRLPYRQSSIVDTIGHDLPHQGIAHERFMPGGPVALLPLSGRRSALVWTERSAVAERIARLDDDAFAAALTERFGDSLGRLRPLGPRRVFPLELVAAESFVADRVALVGDAAHAMHPVAGQGFNLGLRDVAALAEVMADAVRLGLDPGAATVLRDYQRRRRFDSASLMASTDGLVRLFSNDVTPVRAVRDLGLGLVERIPPFKRMAIRHAMGTLGTLPRLLRGEPL